MNSGKYNIEFYESYQPLPSAPHSKVTKFRKALMKLTDVSTTTLVSKDFVRIIEDAHFSESRRKKNRRYETDW